MIRKRGAGRHDAEERRDAAGKVIQRALDVCNRDSEV